MKNLFLVALLIIVISCKKECPEPTPSDIDNSWIIDIIIDTPNQAWDDHFVLRSLRSTVVPSGYMIQFPSVPGLTCTWASGNTNIIECGGKYRNREYFLYTVEEKQYIKMCDIGELIPATITLKRE